MKRNVAGQVVVAQLNSKTTGAPVTSGTTTCNVLGDGGTQAVGSVGSGACTHEGNGVWSYAPAQAETNYAHVAFTFVNASAVTPTVQIYPSFPQTVDASTRAAPGDAMALTTGERNAVADATLDRDMSVGTDSGSPTVRTMRQALRFLRNKWGVAGGTLTVTKEDDTTSSWTASVSATAGANPVTGVDPA